ncbi:MAG TPA: YdcF family protein [Thermoanaerobaculia bacterium]|nr:YdcF family protein [Thermoanaerobaculia bacterium]
MRGLVEIFRRSVIAVLLTLLVLWTLSAIAVLVWSERDQARPAGAVVVLGAAQYAGRPSPVLKARLDHGIELWRRDPSGLLVLTGGTGSGDTTSEAEVGRSYVRKQGVPDSMIVVENAGRTTSESMRAVAEILRERRASSALLVSDPFHMLRLWVIAKRLGLTAYTSPTQTSPISPNREERWKYIMSESIKAPLAFLFERPLVEQ